MGQVKSSFLSPWVFCPNDPKWNRVNPSYLNQAFLCNMSRTGGGRELSTLPIFPLSIYNRNQTLHDVTNTFEESISRKKWQKYLNFLADICIFIREHIVKIVKKKTNCKTSMKSNQILIFKFSI